MKARDTDYYVKIGAAGGRNGHTGGFAASPAKASIAGRIGGRANKGQKKCYVCLKRRHDVTNGICASDQSQDTPELRALLGIDANGRKLQRSVTIASSVSSKSITKKTRPGKKPSEKPSNEQSRSPVLTELDTSEWLTPPNAERRIPVFSAVVDRFYEWRFNRMMNKWIDGAAKEQIGKLGDTSGKEGYGEV